MAKARPIHCRACGATSNVQYAPFPQTIPGAAHGGRWICGDCLYREEHPDAATVEPSRKGKRTQAETLFGGASNE
jgi:hypothetical protein